uniref:Soluble scavenger receptor cysteine-rich domain-containing protein SSC5D n=1 Tax=Gopherus evgoodei TaxID=1825980 RepID=A0A8C4YEC9_9SAUR
MHRNLPECFFPWVFADADISEVAQLRLVNSRSHCAGRVEMLHNRQWGTVCDDSWDLQDARVVCRQLGCGTALSAPGGARFGRGSDRIWLDNVNCTGTEAALSDCRTRPWGENNCNHGEDAGVVCSGNLHPSRHCGSHCAGRVEVLRNQQWGTVCDDSWDLQDAEVVCRQLGCGTALSAPREARFGQGSDHIWLDNVNCTGTEIALSDCRARLWGENNCTHGEDAGVVCSGAGISEVAQIRLVNSPSRCAGRVEVLHNQKWGTVCDDSWDLQDAGVVCRQLACGTALSAPGGARFGQGSDQIWLDDVNCTGTEFALSSCGAQPWGNNNCNHEEDASVVCSVVQLRLVNGPSLCAGRVEVLHNQLWGTVCDDSWDLQDARVVCRQLACGTALSAPRGAQFGRGSDHIWLDYVKCRGTEAALTDCRAQPWGENNCTHGEDAGVVCSAQLRLVNGPSRCAGRVEVLHNHQWGTVCDDSWDLQDARVVCRQLGCGTVLSAPGMARFGRGSDHIWLDYVNCTGTEAALTDCRAQPWGENNCTHGEDAGVVCSELTQVRLVNSPSHCAGRVEVLYNHQWGTVCDDSWDLQDTAVVCRQLGCGTALSAPRGARFGRGSDHIWLDDVNCTGTEVALSDCRARPWGDSNCTHGEDASVVCSGNLDRAGKRDPALLSESALNPVPHGLRLVNGPSRCAGRVEVFHKQQWGTVCDDSWDITDAGVVCRQLGCGTALLAPTGAHFGQGSDHIWLDDVNCTSTEAALSDCRARHWGDNNCTHGEDAGVVCSEVAPLRLVNGPSRCAGRVEVLHNQQWGTVCDGSWGLSEAEVVCRQLGCGTALSAPRGARFGQGSDRVWLDEVQCTGAEAALTECRAKPWGEHGCNPGEDLRLRLTSGPSPCSGRVEVLINNTWGAVCDAGWGLPEAGVVCKQLGCGTVLSAPGLAQFGHGAGDVWLEGVSCSGQESLISECQLSWLGPGLCGHGSEASVVCAGQAGECPAPSPASPGSGAGGCYPCRQTQSTDLRGREPEGLGEESGGQGLREQLGRGLWELVSPTPSVTYPSRPPLPGCSSQSSLQPHVRDLC